jgi:putative flippase GtrA
MENQSSSFKFTLTYGIYTGVVIVIFSLLTYVAEISHDSPINKWIPFLFYLIAMFIGVKNWRDKQSNGFVSFGKAYSISFTIALFAAIIGTIYTFVFMSYIDPSISELILKSAEQGMLDKGYTDEQIDQGMKYVEMFSTSTGIAIWTIVVSCIFFALLSLFPAAILKKEEHFV